MTDNIRDYGLPDSSPTSRPIASPAPENIRERGCPHCGCKELMNIGLEVEQPLLKNGKGNGTYLGCPACPFASPMIIVSSRESL